MSIFLKYYYHLLHKTILTFSGILLLASYQVTATPDS